MFPSLSSSGLGWSLPTAVLVTMVMVVGCSQDSQPPCPPAQATFRLHLDADGEPLPENTTVTVTYGGSEEESYVLGEDSVGNEVVCCKRSSVTEAVEPVVCNQVAQFDASSLDASLEAEDGTAIHCELWTNGAARVQIEAPGYSPLEQILEAQLMEVDEDEARDLRGCAMLQTSTVTLQLYAQDGGAP